MQTATTNSTPTTATALITADGATSAALASHAGYLPRSRANVAGKTAMAFQLAAALRTYGSRRLQSRQQQQQLTVLLSRLLREPLRTVRRAVKQNRKFLSQVERYRNRPQSDKALAHYSGQFTVPQARAYRQLLRQDRRSRLLVSYHFGDFVYGSNTMAGLEPAEREQYFLTQLNSTAAFLNNMTSCFGEKFRRRQQLTLNTATPAMLSAVLRKPASSLMTFADLPAGFGERVAVEFLGRRAWFPKGPATLALVNKVPLLPVINISEGHGNRILLATQIEPDLRSKESLAMAIERITQQLVNILELAVSRYPWQWRFLTALPSFFTDDSPVAKTNPQANIMQSKECDHDGGCQKSGNQDD